MITPEQIQSNNIKDDTSHPFLDIRIELREYIKKEVYK